jgi:hypothetical protein
MAKSNIETEEIAKNMAASPEIIKIIEPLLAKENPLAKLLDQYPPAREYAPWWSDLIIDIVENLQLQKQ